MVAIFVRGKWCKNRNEAKQEQRCEPALLGVDLMMRLRIGLEAIEVLWHKILKY